MATVAGDEWDATGKKPATSRSLSGVRHLLKVGSAKCYHRPSVANATYNFLNMIDLSRLAQLPGDKIAGELACEAFESPLWELRERLEEIPEPLRVFLLIIDFDVEVANGGMMGFLQNSTGRYLAETVEALRRIRAPETAAALVRVQEILDKHGVTHARLRDDIERSAKTIVTFSELHGETLKQMAKEIEREADGITCDDTAAEPISILLGKYVTENNLPFWKLWRALQSEILPFAQSRIQNLQRLLHIGHAQDEQALLRIRRRGAVGVFDVDLFGGKLVRDLRERAGFVVALDQQHVVLNHESPVLFEDMDRLPVVAQDHANDDVVHGVAGGEGEDVDLRFGQRVANARERAGPVLQKNGELFGDVHDSSGVEVWGAVHLAHAQG